MDKDPDATSRISRRRFLRDVGAATVVATDALNPALARAQGSRLFSASAASARPTVAVFGGGIAGLTAAHELAERGFAVTVYERRAWGGKARSTEVPGSATGGRRMLPGEHGFRFEFGFYQNIPDTMRRIPFGSNPNGVFDNLVGAPQVAFARTMKRDVVLPLGGLNPRPYTPQQVIDLLVGVLLQMELPPDAAIYFAQRMVVFFSSCDARRLGEWENTTWTDFIGTDRYPADYRKLLGALPQFTQASKPESTSASWVGLALEVLIYGLLGFGTNGPNFRVLDGPTNDTWIDPWLEVLRGLDVSLRLGDELTAFEFSDGRLAGASMRNQSGYYRVEADWYVCALPVEYARRLWTPAILGADPGLANMQKLGTAWINGVQFYLRTRPDIVDGLLICADSPWAITAVPQTQFWAGDFAKTYGNGGAHEKLSTIIADWTQPGIIYGRPARDLAPEQVVRELWEQLKLHVNKSGQPPKLTDDMVVGTDIDPGMLIQGGHLVSEDALVLPTAGTERYRPDVTTAIPNLVLCGDYLKGAWQVAIMEAASYNGRRAANAVLASAGSRETPAATIPPYRPPEWDLFKQIDADRFANGQPNLLDTTALLPPQPKQLLSSLGLGPVLQSLGLA